MTICWPRKRTFLDKQPYDRKLHVSRTYPNGALRTEFKGRGLDMKTMTAAITIAKQRQLVPVSKETLDELISEVENKLPAPED